LDSKLAAKCTAYAVAEFQSSEARFIPDPNVERALLSPIGKGQEKLDLKAHALLLLASIRLKGRRASACADLRSARETVEHGPDGIQSVTQRFEMLDLIRRLLEMTSPERQSRGRWIRWLSLTPGPVVITTQPIQIGIVRSPCANIGRRYIHRQLPVLPARATAAET
jgi:hypothetical protein